MKATFTISEDDYAKAMLLGTRIELRRFTRLGVLVVLLIAFLAWINEETWGFLVGGVGMTVFLILYFVTMRAFVVPRSFRKHYRKYKLMHEPVTAELTDEAIVLDAAPYRSRFTWDYFIGFRENEDYFLLSVAPRLFHILPKRIAEQGFDFDKLRGHIEAAAG